MDNVQWLADIIYEYPTETVTRSGCEGLAKHLIENGVKVFPVVPGHEDKYNIAEMSYNNGYEKGYEKGFDDGACLWKVKYGNQQT